MICRSITRATCVLLAALAGGGSAAAASPTPADSLGPPPQRCASGVHDCLGGLSYDEAQGHDEASDSLTVSYLGGLVLDRHLVHVGDQVTATIVDAMTQPCFGSPHCVTGYDWSNFEALGKKVSGCVSGDYQATTCTIKVTAASRPPAPGGEPWDKAVVTICGPPGCANDQDFIYVQGTSRGLSGYVKDPSGKPVRGARVTIGSQYTKTDVSGFYSAILDPATYSVSALGTAGPGRATSCTPGAIHGTDCNVDLKSGDGVADFELAPLKHTISFAFQPATAIADGTGRFDGAVSDADEAGDPVAGEAVTLSPPPDVNPGALVCSSHGLVYPTALSDGSALGSHFQATTGADGKIPLSIWPGTVAGTWSLDAAESGDASVFASIAVPFTPPAAAPFPSNDRIAQDLYDAARGSIGGTSGVNIFLTFDAVGQSAASDQAILLAFLQSTGRGSFAGADFAPVHEGDHAGVLFYPRGSSTPTSGPTAVIDVDQAARIIAAAGAGDPLPAGDQTVPTLNGWTPVPGQSPARGSLGAVPGQQLTYFGLPYPPPVTSASAQSSFYGSCLPPDPALETLQVHSPVNLVLTGSGGERFGTDPGGHAVHTAPGLGLTTGDETTYAVPAGSYRVSIAGTGSGQAHLVVLTAGKAAERATTFAFKAGRAQSGELRITSGGPSSTLSFGGRRVRATTGLPLAVRGLTAGLDHRHRRTLKVTVTSLGEAIDGAVISARGDGAGTTAITDRHGRATLALRPAKPGAVRVTVTAASAAPLRRTLHVR